MDFVAKASFQQNAGKNMMPKCYLSAERNLCICMFAYIYSLFFFFPRDSIQGVNQMEIVINLWILKRVKLKKKKIEYKQFQEDTTTPSNTQRHWPYI